MSAALRKLYIHREMLLALTFSNTHKDYYSKIFDSFYISDGLTLTTCSINYRQLIQQTHLSQQPPTRTAIPT